MTRSALLNSPAALLTAKGHLAPRRNEKDRHDNLSGRGGKKSLNLAGTEGQKSRSVK